jgi:hypothetical protein
MSKRANIGAMCADLRAVRTPTSAARRVKNRAVGRVLARAGLWRRLWR